MATRTKRTTSRAKRPSKRGAPQAASSSPDSAAESLFRATYGRDMTDAERQSTVSTSHPVPLDKWMKQK